MRTLETERLILRPWTENDAEALYAYAKNPDVGPHAGWSPHKDVEESKTIIDVLFKPNEVFAMVEKETGKIIGSLGFEPDKRRPNIASKELGYSLAKESWGKGYMTEGAKHLIDFGFDELDLEIISICTGVDNKRSQRVIEKCGFVYEGTERQAYKIYDGTKRDVRCYSILRSEWERKKRRGKKLWER